MREDPLLISQDEVGVKNTSHAYPHLESWSWSIPVAEIVQSYTAIRRSAGVLVEPSLARIQYLQWMSSDLWAGEDRGWDTCNEAAGVLLVQFSNCDINIWYIVIHKDLHRPLELKLFCNRTIYSGEGFLYKQANFLWIFCLNNLSW